MRFRFPCLKEKKEKIKQDFNKILILLNLIVVHKQIRIVKFTSEAERTVTLNAKDSLFWMIIATIYSGGDSKSATHTHSSKSSSVKSLIKVLYMKKKQKQNAA
jgi:hypothetical protein